MPLAILLLRNTVIAVLSAIELAMFVRAILSWFDPMGESKIASFLFVITEPIILPIRTLCAKMHWFENVPLDIPFMLTWLVLMILQIVLETAV